MGAGSKLLIITDFAWLVEFWEVSTLSRTEASGGSCLIDSQQMHFWAQFIMPGIRDLKDRFSALHCTCSWFFHQGLSAFAEMSAAHCWSQVVCQHGLKSVLAMRGTRWIASSEERWNGLSGSKACQNKSRARPQMRKRWKGDPENEPKL